MSLTRAYLIAVAILLIDQVSKIYIKTHFRLDEAINVAVPGSKEPDDQNPHNTISQRLAQMRANGSKSATIACAVLTWIANKIFRVKGDHCTNAVAGFPDDLPTNG